MAWQRFWSPVQVLVLLTLLQTAAATECGGKVDLDSGTTGTVTSPNYPNAYPSWARCIWLLVAPEQYQVELTVTFVGETSGTGCGDYIEVRDGSSTSTELQAETCGTLSGTVLTSSGRWMWLFFGSNEAGHTTGLSATYSAVYAGTVINNISSPVTNCQFYQHQCPNLECISLAYVCDGFYDCGCSPGCDEDSCTGISFAVWERALIGMGTGVTVFVLVVLLVQSIDYYQKWLAEKERERERQRARRQKPLPPSRRGSCLPKTPSPVPETPKEDLTKSSHLVIPKAEPLRQEPSILSLLEQ